MFFNEVDADSKILRAFSAQDNFGLNPGPLAQAFTFRALGAADSIGLPTSLLLIRG
jgi:hypothetical protein